jgi:hypothetical protein
MQKIPQKVPFLTVQPLFTNNIHPVDSSGTHGLACHKSAGHHMRHSSVNDLIERALATASVPSMFEPSSLSREDGKRPDGFTILPWANGRCLI